VCACTINALQGNVPAIKIALGVAILTHRTSFLANNVSTAIARYSLEWPANLMSASCLVSELTVSELTCQRVGLSASCLVSELTVSELVCQRDVCEASFYMSPPVLHQSINLFRSICIALDSRKYQWAAQQGQDIQNTLLNFSILDMLRCPRNDLSANRLVRELVCPRNILSANRRVRELSCPRTGCPRIGLSAKSLVTFSTTAVGHSSNPATQLSVSLQHSAVQQLSQ